MKFIRQQLRSFGYAFQGMVTSFREVHVRMHWLIATTVTIAGFYLGIQAQEWAIILLCYAIVIISETINTALEKLADAVHPDHHPQIGKAKDMAAGAVLVAAIFAVAVGLVIFWPYLF